MMATAVELVIFEARYSWNRIPLQPLKRAKNI